MSTFTVGCLRETAERERRVALDPATAQRLTTSGLAVLVESGAGWSAHFPDADYEAAGAEISSREDVLARADAVAVVRTPDAGLADALHSGQLLVGLVDPLTHPDLMADLATRGVTVAAFELVPRTLSRAQAMDALSSQASAAGYRAGIVAAASFDGYLSMMVTASGTARPASVLVIGAGVAGLQAIATVKRLGAVVTGYDVREASRGEVESPGTTLLTSTVSQGAGAGGYARAMTAEEAVRQRAELSAHLVTFDVVITTAKVPGRTPPLLVTAADLDAMRPGSVCIDLAATEQRGNVAGSVDGRTTVTDHGVVVVGGGGLASDLAAASSRMYAHNVEALLRTLVVDHAFAVDLDDEVHRAVVVCHRGSLTATDPSPTGAPA
ncbi:NAD(P) transhydrogenase subunit alpha [soil metagenome]